MKIRRVLSLVLIFSLMLSFRVSAEETKLLPEGQADYYNAEAVDPRGYLIASRVISITNNEDGTLSALGQIIAHVTLDYAYIALYLDRYNPVTEDWENISYQVAEFTLEEEGEAFMGFPMVSYELSGEDIIPGYYYRLRGTYSASKSGRKETSNAATDGVLLTKVK